ncbi:DUF4917 family protein [Vibrio parahaemolyticus]|uniref:DUF4917 family protein n=1 Tax=Vibrio parahaemolyticus TaxID=670 RepID=UPI001121D09B|nr:DUF4917 family protein [Vibrio parahaemolyticus]TOB85777.1 DUF4917 domain-containing protein [Vibrio parahaemolyticus]
MPLQTFDDTLAQLDEWEYPSILLANGFSRAWNNRIFNYENLFEEAHFGERDQELREIFERFNTFDFEQVMHSLQSAELVCETYRVDRAIINQIRDDQEQLKDSLIEVIANTHPHRPNEIEDEMFESTRQFLTQFSNVFSLNYDMLLYWAVNKTNLAPNKPDRWCGKKDGFFRDEWEQRQQNLHFLHGGLHLYNDGSSVCKRVYDPEDWDAIVDQVRRWLDTGNFPLFVSEPTCEKKLEKIKHNPYLNACYQALGKLENTLYIHGHSIAENDRHIFEQINRSRVNRVFISIHGDEDSRANRDSMANADRFLDRSIDIGFYDAATVPIW